MVPGDKPLAGQRIGLFGRGGSGKSTCSVLLAKALARAGYTVCVVDADSTNEGLPQALGADKIPDSRPGSSARLPRASACFSPAKSGHWDPAQAVTAR